MEIYIFQYTFPSKENKGRMHSRTYVVYCVYDMKFHLKSSYNVSLKLLIRVCPRLLTYSHRLFIKHYTTVDLSKEEMEFFLIPYFKNKKNCTKNGKKPIPAL